MFTKDLTKEQRDTIFAGFSDEQVAEYFDRLANYKAVGHFANRQIAAFKPFVKGAVFDAETGWDYKNATLDEKGVMDAWGLNERQIPFLRIELQAAGWLPSVEAKSAATSSAAQDVRDTRPLSPPAPKAEAD